MAVHLRAACVAPSPNSDRLGGFLCGYLVDGQFQVTVPREVYVLCATESVAFDGASPHRMRNLGCSPARAIWFTHGGT